MNLLIDTNVLRMICHAGRHPDVARWFDGVVERVEAGKIDLFLSCVADYELRRGYLYALLRHDTPDPQTAIGRMDALRHAFPVLPVDAEAADAASRHWARARRGGWSTADERHVDWDIMIAAQAELVDAIVVTTNKKHLVRYGVTALNWNEIELPTP